MSVQFRAVDVADWHQGSSRQAEDLSTRPRLRHGPRNARGPWRCTARYNYRPLGIGRPARPARMVDRRAKSRLEPCRGAWPLNGCRPTLPSDVGVLGADDGVVAVAGVDDGAGRQGQQAFADRRLDGRAVTVGTAGRAGSTVEEGVAGEDGAE